MAIGVETTALSLEDASILTISSGSVTATKSNHVIAAETGTTDDLATITIPSSLSSGFSPFIFLKADTGDTITIKHGTGNISLGSGADFSLSGETVIGLLYDGSNWNDISSSASAISTPVSIAQGGTGQTTQTAAMDALSPTTTKGDLIVDDGTNNVRQAIGTDDQILAADSSQSSGVAWINQSLRFIEEKSLSAATNTTFTGLSGVKKYMLDFQLDNATASTSTIEVRVNVDSDSTDYADQNLLAQGASATATLTANRAAFAVITGDDQVAGVARLSLSPDGGGSYRMICLAQSAAYLAADQPRVDLRAVQKNTVVSSITQIEILASVASSMNGTIALYEVMT